MLDLKPGACEMKIHLDDHDVMLCFLFCLSLQLVLTLMKPGGSLEATGELDVFISGFLIETSHVAVILIAPAYLFYNYCTPCFEE